MRAYRLHCKCDVGWRRSARARQAHFFTDLFTWASPYTMYLVPARSTRSHPTTPRTVHRSSSPRQAPQAVPVVQYIACAIAGAPARAECTLERLDIGRLRRPAQERCALIPCNVARHSLLLSVTIPLLIPPKEFSACCSPHTAAWPGS